MTFYCIGISHKTASVELREQATINRADLNHGFIASGLANGIALISTCNRIELYASASPSVHPDRIIAQWERIADSKLNFAQATYTFKDDAAVNHLFRVSAGLESMVLGEPQILGQVSRASESAIADGTADAIIKSVFKSAIRSGKRARTETAISRNSVSVSTIGVSIINRYVSDKENAKILVVGAGEMAQLAVKGLRQFGLGNITILNRNADKARTLAESWGVKGTGLDQLEMLLPTADGLISATSSFAPVVTSKHVENRSRPLVMIDLAVPRDIDPVCQQNSAVTLFDVDALNGEVAEGIAERQRAVPEVELILTEEHLRYQAWLQESTVHPTLHAMRQQAEEIRRKELARTLKYLGEVEPDMLKHIDKLSQTIVKQLLHRPTMALRDEARNGTLNGLDKSAQKLFDL
ncbi:MAG: glutamyl-tRNA reductase [Chloroflexota bacterium]